MAIEFARTHIIGRSGGHSAVKAAAYRSGTDLFDAALGKTVHYAHRGEDVVHSAVLLPAGADAALLDRQTLWTMAEIAENSHSQRARAQLAKDHIVALPVELSLAQQIDLVTSFAQEHFVSRGVAVDLNIHQHSEGNPHAHIMVTTRFVGRDGFGAKARELNGNFVGGKRIADEVQLRHWWAEHQNAWAQENGVDLLVTNNNGEWAAEVHRGPTRHMAQATERGAMADAAVEDRQSLLMKDPTPLILRLSEKKAVFNGQDLYVELSNHLPDHTHLAAAHHNALRSDALVPIGERDAAGVQWYTTHQALDQEMQLLGVGERLNRPVARFDIAPGKVDRAIDRGFDFLSGEQRDAVHHLCADARRVGVVVGLAGAGKSTMLEAARTVWEQGGHRVFGLALAGKAAQGLEDSAGIDSRTIHSFLKALDRGNLTLESSDVIVLDEAGMVNTDLMLGLTERVEAAGAKLVLVGDPEQLQPIQAGNPLRAFGERFGYVEMEGVRRHSQAWQREATVDLARGHVAQALDAYREHGAMQVRADRAGALEAMIHDTSREVAGRMRDSQSTASSASGTPPRTMAVLAQTNRDVDAINAGIRSHLVGEGLITMGHPFAAVRTVSKPEARTVSDFSAGDAVLFGLEAAQGVSAGQRGEVTAIGGDAVTVALADGRAVEVSPDALEPVRQYQATEEGATDEQHLAHFSAGDRVLFGRNDTRLGVKNGSLGTVLASARNKLDVRLDSGEKVRVNAGEYDAVSHGYAMTVHKSQGVTVDDTRVLVTRGWDKHLTYVGLSRHRHDLKIYYGKRSFLRPFGESQRSGAGQQDAAHQEMASVLGTARRQQNILDFAQSRGLVVEDGRFVLSAGADSASADDSAVPDAYWHTDRYSGREDDPEDHELPEYEQIDSFAVEVAADDAIYDLAEGEADPVHWDPMSEGDALSAREADAVDRILSGYTRLKVVSGDSQAHMRLLAPTAQAMVRDDRRVLGLAGSDTAAAALQQRTGMTSQSVSSWLRQPRGMAGGDLLVLDGHSGISGIDLLRTLFHANRQGVRVALVSDQDAPRSAAGMVAAVAHRAGWFDLERGDVFSSVTRDEARAKLVTRMAAAGLDLRDGRVHIIPDTDLEQRAKRAELLLRESTNDKMAAARQPIDRQRRELQAAYAQSQQVLADHARQEPGALRLPGAREQWRLRGEQLEEALRSAGGRLWKFNDELKGRDSPMRKIEREAMAKSRKENPQAAALSDAWHARRASRVAIRENRWEQRRSGEQKLRRSIRRGR